MPPHPPEFVPVVCPKIQVSYINSQVVVFQLVGTVLPFRSSGCVASGFVCFFQFVWWFSVCLLNQGFIDCLLLPCVFWRWWFRYNLHMCSCQTSCQRLETMCCKYDETEPIQLSPQKTESSNESAFGFSIPDVCLFPEFVKENRIPHPTIMMAYMFASKKCCPHIFR